MHICRRKIETICNFTGSPSPLMYFGVYQFDWLCAYNVVLLGSSITGYDRLICTMIMLTGVLVMHTTGH